MTDTHARRIAVVGLGYVGLPLAVAFSRKVDTVGFDVSEERISTLRKGFDVNGEVAAEDLLGARLSLTSAAADLDACDVFIVAVPTPVDRVKRPDLTALRNASKLVGEALRRREARSPATPAIVVYESTVYPGCTEEVCIPLLESASGLRWRQGFHVGYSPERINPGDRQHTLRTVIKVVAGDTPETTDALARLYGLVAEAGIHRAPDLRTAEAAKVIENTQRDINIALMNELSILFHRLGIDTQEVLKAARTKWNFLPFEPGLVGGHCIPEDPYYLTHKAQEVGYHPQVILAGRRINDDMGTFVAQETIKLLIRAGRPVSGARVLVLGLAFKENVSDVRSTRVADVARELASYGCEVLVHDPKVPADAVRRMGLSPVESPFSSGETHDAVVLAVPHREFRARTVEEMVALCDATRGRRVLVDVKGAFAQARALPNAPLYWSL